MRSKKLTWPIMLGVCAWLVLPAVPARAGVLLSTLLHPGATISSGGLTFSHFAYSKTGSMPSPLTVTVNPILLSGNYGLQFVGAFTTPKGSTADALITYKVTVTSGAPVSSALLTGNPKVTGGTGDMFVVRTVSLRLIRLACLSTVSALVPRSIRPASISARASRALALKRT